MAKSGPLRKVVGFVGMPLSMGAYLRTQELLECGHAQPPVRDAFGETAAGRRRCRGCAAGLAARPELQDLVKLAKPGEFVRHADPLATGHTLID